MDWLQAAGQNKNQTAIAEGAHSGFGGIQILRGGITSNPAAGQKPVHYLRLRSSLSRDVSVNTDDIPANSRRTGNRL